MNPTLLLFKEGAAHNGPCRDGTSNLGVISTTLQTTELTGHPLEFNFNLSRVPRSVDVPPPRSSLLITLTGFSYQHRETTFSLAQDGSLTPTVPLVWTSCDLEATALEITCNSSAIVFSPK